jgi:uncharacterized protein YjbI with pentapeptide repeats
MCVYSGGSEGQLVLRSKQLAPGTSLRDAELSSADFSGSLCEGVDFSAAKLDGSVAIDAYFAGAIFDGASLRGVDFSGSDLRGARFVNADLTDADFEQTDCTGCDFSGASVERARFPGAILADITRALRSGASPGGDNRVAPTHVAGTWIERMNAMVDELRAHEGIVVHHFVVGEPASEQELLDAEASLGWPLPPALRAFYAAHNGIALAWGFEDAEEEVPEPFEFPDYGTPPGMVNLLPVGDAWSKSWEADSHVNEVDDSLQEKLFGAVPDPLPPVGAVVVDNYSKWSHGDLVLGGPDGGLMIVSSDHGAEMDSSDGLPFDAYLEMILATWGTCRYKGGLGSRNEPKRLATWSRHRPLSAILEEVRED